MRGIDNEMGLCATAGGCALDGGRQAVDTPCRDFTAYYCRHSRLWAFMLTDGAPADAGAAAFHTPSGSLPVQLAYLFRCVRGIGRVVDQTCRRAGSRRAFGLTCDTLCGAVVCRVIRPAGR